MTEDGKVYLEKEDWNDVRHGSMAEVEFPKLDPFKADIDAWITEDKKAKRKQRHTAQRIYDRLVKEHTEEFTCSYRTVAGYVAKRKKEIFGQRPGFSRWNTFRGKHSPADIFAFLDEHPDSISDGYFLEKASSCTYPPNGGWGAGGGSEWIRLPASYHNGASSFSFADGHAEIHRWQYAATKPPALPDAAGLPIAIPGGQTADFAWVVDRMSVDR